VGGVVGRDASGERLVALLEDAGASCDGIVRDPARPTTTKTRVLAHGQQVVRTDLEQRTPLSAEAESSLLGWVSSAAADADVIVLSDYAKGVVSDRLARGVIEAARTNKKPVVVDPKGHDYQKYVGATVLTPNVHDAKRAAKLAPDDYVELRALADAIRETLPGSALLITQGARGMTLVSDASLVEIDAEAQEVFDVTGAGDTVVATVAVALGCGGRLEEAAQLANRAAGIVVSKVGTSTVTLDELAS
jgi:D-beta-D-heptose 7-phosphate kinase/D-beta-D-heptose 1-phosphate adenosyltransferase